MKIGFGLYKHMLNDKYYSLARQLGATHIVAHLTDYFNQSDTGSDDQPLGTVEKGWGVTIESEIWSLDELLKLKTEIANHGLVLEAIENFSPAFWYDILLNGPRREEQIINLKQFIRNLGKAGIPIMGYNFSLAGVAGRIIGPYARGGALSVGLEGYSVALDTPIPNGMVWNMIYDTHAASGYLETISREELINRYKYFIREMIPVAEEAGVKLALHPDDPPLKEVRRQPRLGFHPDHYKRIMNYDDSTSHVMELCLGTIAEMEGSDVYEALEYFAEKNKIGYIHFRNVKGKVPSYKESFIDDGDIDMYKIVQILRKHDFQGVLIPDHTPQMSSESPWDVGMAYAMGFMNALINAIR